MSTPAGLSGAPGRPSGNSSAEATGDRSGDELVDLSAERGDLLHAARGDEAVLRARHHVHRLDVGGERRFRWFIWNSHSKSEITRSPLTIVVRAPAAGEVDDELGEDVDLDVLEPASSASSRNATRSSTREHRLLVVRVADDADDDAVEDRGGARDHVDVADRDRVVRAGADRGDHRRARRASAARSRSGGSCATVERSKLRLDRARPTRRRRGRRRRARRRGGARVGASSVGKHPVRRVDEHQVVAPPAAASSRERTGRRRCDDRRRSGRACRGSPRSRARVAVGLDEDAARGAARERLEPHRARAGEEVEHARRRRPARSG